MSDLIVPGKSLGYSDIYLDFLKGQDSARHFFQPGIDIFDLMRTRAAALGQLVNIKYAEAYTIKEQILIDDPQKMPVWSV